MKHRKMKHISMRGLLRVAALLAALSLLAAACGGDDDSTNETSSDSATESESDPDAEQDADPADDAESDDGSEDSDPPAEVVELTLLTGFTGGDRFAYESIVNRFNEAHPGINVTMDVQPWDSIGQTLPSAWGTGSGPDIATPNFDPGIVFRYIDDGLVLALDDLLGDGSGQLDPGVVPGFVSDAFTVDGTLYAAPANVATLQLYYNRALLEAAGFADPPATSAELLDYSLEITDGEVFGISLADHATIQMWPLLIWMNGGDVMGSATCSALGDAATVAALESWTAAVAGSGVSPIGQTGGESDSLFAAGQAALQMNGPWAAPGYTEAGIDFGVAPIPAGADGQITLASTVPMMVSAGTDHPVEAQQFLAWWNSAEAQKQFALDSGFPPSRTDLADDPDIQGNAVVAQFASALPDARLYMPGVAVAAQIDGDVFVPLIESITRGADVAESASSAAEAANALAGCAG